MKTSAKDWTGTRKRQEPPFKNPALNVAAILFIVACFALGVGVSQGHQDGVRMMAGVGGAVVAGILVGLLSITPLGRD